MQNQTLIFIGRSGAGKGTQVKLLMDKLKDATKKEVLYVEAGARFREFIATESFSSHEAKEIQDRGGLQPSFLSIWMWSDILVKNMKGDEHVIFDGTPRRMSEAKVLESALKFYGHERPKVVFIDVCSEWAMARLSERGRSDDTEESILKRMDWYDRDVTGAIEYMKNNPYYEYIEINGEQTIPEVHAEICRKLNLV